MDVGGADLRGLSAGQWRIYTKVLAGGPLEPPPHKRLG